VTPVCRTSRKVKYHGTWGGGGWCVQNCQHPVSLGIHKEVWPISGSVKNSLSTKFEQAHFDLSVRCFTISYLILLNFTD